MAELTCQDGTFTSSECRVRLTSGDQVDFEFRTHQSQTQVTVTVPYWMAVKIHEDLVSLRREVEAWPEDHPWLDEKPGD